MRIGLVGAMQEEIDLLKKDVVDLKIIKIGLREYYQGQLYGQETILVFSKCGKVASASTVTALIERFKVNLVLFTGMAGAICPTLKIGDVVIANSLVQHDLDASALPMFKKFEVPLLGITHFKVNDQLMELARQSTEEYIKKYLFKELSKETLKKFNISLPKTVVGLIASGDQFIVCNLKKDNLRNEIKGIKCVEMEGAAVAQVCFEYKIPFVVIRIISDEADSKAGTDFLDFMNNVVMYYSRGIVKIMLSRLKNIKKI